MFYRSKDGVEAMQLTTTNADEVKLWADPSGQTVTEYGTGNLMVDSIRHDCTLEARPGDYIVKHNRDNRDLDVLTEAVFNERFEPIPTEDDPAGRSGDQAAG